jgi:ABC-2 type transport system permease protein
MISLRKVLSVTRYEFTVTVTRKSFLMVALGMPILLVGSGTVGALLTTRQFKPAQLLTIALVDQAKILKPEALSASAKESQPTEKDPVLSAAQSKVRFIPYAHLDQALAALLREEVAACYLIEADYLASGNITTFVRESKFTSGGLPVVKEQLYDSIRASLLDEWVTGAVRNRLLEKPKFQNKEVSPQGDIKPEMSVIHKSILLVGPAFFVIMLSLSIFTASSLLLQGLAIEKQNRVIEVLLSSLTHEELLAGKIVGLGLAGLVQTSIYAVLLGFPLAPILWGGDWKVLLLSIVYVTLGYLLFASLMVATGAFFSGEQEANQLSALWLLMIIAPAFFLALAPGLDSWVAKSLSYFPLTAPTTMLIRLSWSKAGIEDVLLSVAALIVGIYLAVHFAARVFRLASLMYGKPPNLPELLRVLRAA